MLSTKRSYSAAVRRILAEEPEQALQAFGGCQDPERFRRVAPPCILGRGTQEQRREIEVADDRRFKGREIMQMPDQRWIVVQGVPLPSEDPPGQRAQLIGRRFNRRDAGDRWDFRCSRRACATNDDTGRGSTGWEGAPNVTSSWRCGRRSSG